MAKIKDIRAYEILASGGLPTIECRVETDDGKQGTASVSYGASAGSHEATVLADYDPARYGGQGVLKMCQTIEKVIAPRLLGMEVAEQQKLDALMIDLDGSVQKEKLGGNTILAVSMAFARAGAACGGLELYEYLQQTYGLEGAQVMPKPMVVVIEGGAHADNSTDLQEYLLDVTFSDSISENVRVASEIYQAAKKILKAKGFSVNVGNEGAFAPEGIGDNELPLQILLDAIVQAGYKPGADALLSLDAAASEFYKDGLYHFSRGSKDLSAPDLLGWYRKLVVKYPMYSLEDPFAEDAWQDWSTITAQLGGQVRVIGDDLTVTNAVRLQKAIDQHAINAILIKLNQAGTVSETIEACKIAKEHRLAIVPSHRGGGESNDTFISDLAVAVGADFLKTGITRGERVAKYNRLMEIERHLLKR